MKFFTTAIIFIAFFTNYTFAQHSNRCFEQNSDTLSKYVILKLDKCQQIPNNNPHKFIFFGKNNVLHDSTTLVVVHFRDGTGWSDVQINHKFGEYSMQRFDFNIDFCDSPFSSKRKELNLNTLLQTKLVEKILFSNNVNTNDLTIVKFSMQESIELKEIFRCIFNDSETSSNF